MRTHPDAVVTRGGRLLSSAAVVALSEVRDDVPFCGRSKAITDDLVALGLIENTEPRLLAQQRNTQAYVLTPYGEDALNQSALPLTGWRARVIPVVRRLAVLGGPLKPVEPGPYVLVGWVLEVLGLAVLITTSLLVPPEGTVPTSAAVAVGAAGVLLLGAGVAFSRVFARGRVMFVLGIPVAIVVAPVWALLRLAVLVLAFAPLP